MPYATKSGDKQPTAVVVATGSHNEATDWLEVISTLPTINHMLFQHNGACNILLLTEVI